jgi:deaminated glutathione amidase
MTPFAIAGIQTHIAVTHANVEHLRHRLDLLMTLFPWVQMVLFSELAPYGPNHHHAEAMPGPTEGAFQEMAAKHQVWLLPGSMFERSGDNIYNTASVIDPTGTVVGRYRKMFPFLPYEVNVAGGTEFLVFDVPDVGRFGVSICYDMWFPETTRTLAALGAEVILHPVMTGTVDRDVELAMARASAAMFQCYVFDINGLGAGGIGRSIIVDPSGTVLAQAGDHEQLLPIEIDLDVVRHQRKTGVQGLGQPLKSFRDRAVEFTVYDRTSFDDRYLRSLGPLAKRTRNDVAAAGRLAAGAESAAAAAFPDQGAPIANADATHID